VIDVRMAGARTDKLWREAPQSLNLIEIASVINVSRVNYMEVVKR
jgi:hypothetical protein